MSARTDHTANSRAYLASAHSLPVDVKSATLKLAEAQVHATLALVEQQRIANLIAVASLNSREADFTKPWTSTEDTEAWRSVRDEVAEALGLA